MGLIFRTALTLNDKDDGGIRDIAERWIAATRAEEGVIGFHGFLDEATGRFIFLEHYRDSEAFLIHRDLVDQDLRARLYAIAKFESLEVYGTPSPEVCSILAPSGAAIFTHIASR